MIDGTPNPQKQGWEVPIKTEHLKLYIEQI